MVDEVQETLALLVVAHVDGLNQNTVQQFRDDEYAAQRVSWDAHDCDVCCGPAALCLSTLEY